MNPQDKLKSETQRARELLAQIEQALTILEARKSIDWADVGDANRIKNDLQKIVRYARSF
jgi:hypothetical protein